MPLDELGEEKMQAVRGVFILKTRLKKPTRVAEVSNVISIKEMDPHGWEWTVMIAAAPASRCCQEDVYIIRLENINC